MAQIQGLDAKESRFIDEYMIDLNTERAAIAAGYSASMARSKAYQWVSNSKVKPKVTAEINRRKAALSRAAEVTAEDIARELAKVGFASMRRAMRIDMDGQPQINLTATPDDDLDALSEISTETVLERDGVDGAGNPRFIQVRKTKIKFHDKLSALEKLAQRTNFYKQRDDNFASAVAEIQSRTSRAPINRQDDEADE